VDFNFCLAVYVLPEVTETHFNTNS